MNRVGERAPRNQRPIQRAGANQKASINRPQSAGPNQKASVNGAGEPGEGRDENFFGRRAPLFHFFGRSCGARIESEAVVAEDHDESARRLLAHVIHNGVGCAVRDFDETL